MSAETPLYEYGPDLLSDPPSPENEVVILEADEWDELLDELDESYAEIDELNKIADSNEETAFLFAAALEYIAALPPGEDTFAAPYVASFARSLAVFKSPEEL